MPNINPYMRIIRIIKMTKIAKKHPAIICMEAPANGGVNFLPLNRHLAAMTKKAQK